MRAAATTAGMLSAAVLLSSGCDSRDEKNVSGEAAEPLRWATFRVLAARDFLATCPAAAGRPEPIRAAERFDELRRFAARKGAAHALWLAENDYGGVARHGGRAPCEAGNEAFGQALAGMNGALDELGGRIAAMSQ